jgi:hypothetical protein
MKFPISGNVYQRRLSSGHFFCDLPAAKWLVRSASRTWAAKIPVLTIARNATNILMEPSSSDLPALSRTMERMRSRLAPRGS